jgi:predicted PurR-regulated permease PerM
MDGQGNRSRNVSHTTPSHSVPTTSGTIYRSWLRRSHLPAVRSVILGTTLFVALLVWVAFSVGLIPQGTHLIDKLRVLGVTTWLYALVQIIDMKVWHSRFAQRRRAASRVPEVVEGWLLAQMLSSFGLVYYALTDDARWFVAGIVMLLLSFVVFPIRDET